ncbi:MAG: hypothetical protein ACFUZC_17020 [Chthoniobacteraceae bacterium]
MNITMPSNATTSSIKAAHPVPRGTTHFRFTAPKRKPVIDGIKNLDVLAGCEGKLEYGKAIYKGRGRHAMITGFTVFATAQKKKPDPVAAAVPSLEPQTANVTPKPALAKGKLNRIFGFSACAVAKTLGKAGVKYAEGDRIFRVHGIEMSKASLSVQLGFGRNSASWKRHGQPANLTETQVAELRAEVAVPSTQA